MVASLIFVASNTLYCLRVAGFSSVVVSLLEVVAGSTDGSFRRSTAGCIVVDSLVVVEIEGSCRHPGRACRVVLGWKILSSFVFVVVT